MFSERSISYGFCGIVSLAFAGLFYRYRGTGMLSGLTTCLFIAGIGCVAFAIYLAFQVRKVTTHDVKCPFCEALNTLVAAPTDDFPCVSCNRMIPVIDGKTIPVSQVRCGFCNELNFYSEKTEVLLCENCNHEIPIAHDETGAPRKTIPAAFVVVDDEALYELSLIGHGKHKEEELISGLQHILALNRNQVKQMLTELPITVLTGITRKKAEMLKAQLSLYEAEVEFSPMEEARR
ncbi:MAG: hypothetical protein P4L46_17645 [Fimbriimonas sp.]|nr:hypothetical protein [Fimbriimonas sp.]